MTECCWKYFVLLCVLTEHRSNAVPYSQATQASHPTPQPGSLATGSLITHIMAHGASDRALKKKTAETYTWWISRKADAHFRNRNSHRVGIMQQLKCSVGR